MRHATHAHQIRNYLTTFFDDLMIFINNLNKRCQNGQCVVQGNSFQCMCPQGYTGKKIKHISFLCYLINIFILN